MILSYIIWFWIDSSYFISISSHFFSISIFWFSYTFNSYSVPLIILPVFIWNIVNCSCHSLSFIFSFFIISSKDSKIPASFNWFFNLSKRSMSQKFKRILIKIRVDLRKSKLLILNKLTNCENILVTDFLA